MEPAPRICLAQPAVYSACFGRLRSRIFFFFSDFRSVLSVPRTCLISSMLHLSFPSVLPHVVAEYLQTPTVVLPVPVLTLSLLCLFLSLSRSLPPAPRCPRDLPVRPWRAATLGRRRCDPGMPQPLPQTTADVCGERVVAAAAAAVEGSCDWSGEHHAVSNSQKVFVCVWHRYEMGGVPGYRLNFFL